MVVLVPRVSVYISMRTHLQAPRTELDYRVIVPNPFSGLFQMTKGNHIIQL